MSTANDSARDVAVSAADLPLHCPPPSAPLWSRHPRVFLDVTKSGSARCPYCGANYRFTGAKPKGHH